MPKYNGHANWNHWNVSLWLNNDESLYRTMLYAIRYSKTISEAVYTLIGMLPAQTPDGAPYSKSAVRAAIADYRDQIGRRS